MAHQRQAIRAAIVSTLLSAATAAGSRVYPWRLNAWDTGSGLPAIAIYARTESVEVASIDSPAVQDRVLEIAVEAIGSGASVADDIDSLAAQIEIALANNRTLGGACKTLELIGTEIDLDGGGEIVVGTATLNYRARYQTLDTNPTAAL